MHDSGKNNDVPQTGPSLQAEPLAVTTSTTGNANRVLAVMIVMVFCIVMVGDVQGVALSPLISTISHQLNLTGGQIGWIITGYTLVGAAFSGLLSRLGDSVGAKRVLVPILAAATVGAVIGAVANSLEFLVIGRMLMGLAVPAMPLMWGLVRPRATARQNRLMSFGIATAAGVGIPVSLMLGGFFVSVGVPWQAIFWLTAFFLASALVLLLAVPKSSATHRVRVPLDVVGGLGLGVWLTLLLLALTYGPSDGWTSPNVVIFTVIGVAVLAAWIMQQVKNPHRLIAFRREDLRQMLSGYMGVWAGGFLAPILMFVFLPALLQTPSATGYGFGLTLIESALPMLLLAPVSIFFQVTLAPLTDRFGPRTTLVAGGVLTALGFFGLAVAADTFFLVFVWFFLYACGAMLMLMTGYSLTTAAGRQDNISVTMGLQYAVGNIVSSVAVAVALASFIPNAEGILPESVFTDGFVGAGITLLVCAAAWFCFVPKKFVDKHAAIAVAQEHTQAVTASVHD